MKNIFAFFILIIGLHAKAGVWSASNSWSDEYEARYAEWIQVHFKEDFFSNPSKPWFGVATDCADAVYAARIAFAYENSLPVQFTSIESMRPQLSNKLGYWDHLPEKQRVLQFIRHVSDMTSTKTLGYDTYPVKIDRTYIEPGTIFLNPTLTAEEENIIGTRGGHAEVVIDIEENGFIRTLYSTTPSKVRTLITNRNPYTWPISKLGGFRAWKKHELPTELQPGYSLEQFQLAGWSSAVTPTRKQIYQWHETIRRTLRLRPPTIDERRDVLLESICNLWQGRATAVTEAWQNISANGRRCLSRSLMDEHSTQKRDARIREAYGQLNDLMFWRKNEYNPENALGSIKDAKDELQKCVVNINYTTINAWELFLRMIDNHLVSDASWEPRVRWGELSKLGGQKCR